MTSTPALVARAGFVVLAGLAAAAAAEDAATARGRLDLAGGVLAGDLVPVAAESGGVRDTFLWRSPRFADPLEFPVGEVAGIVYPAAAREAGAGPVVHLRGGDIVLGTIESLDADAIVVATAGSDGPQRLRIARGEVAAIARSATGGGSYVGPSGLVDWVQTPHDSWREEAGRIMSDKPGAGVTRDVHAPVRARFAIRLSRRGAAEFKIVVAATERPHEDPYFLQAVAGEGGGLMLVCRANGKAKIEPLPATAWRGDALHVVLFVDQERGRFAAVFPDAEAAEDRRPREITLPAQAPRASGRFRLELDGEAISLDRLEVTPWRGDEPTLGDAGATAIATREGPLDGFTVTSFDAAGGAYVLARGAETRRLPAADVEEIRFPERGGGQPPHALQVLRTDGGTLFGDLVSIDDRAVWLRRQGIDAAVAIPRAAILEIRSLLPAKEATEPTGRVGTLVAGADRVRGWLTGGDGDEEGGLAWRPLGSTTSARLASPVDAEIEYVSRRDVRKDDGVEVGGIGGQVVPTGDGGFIVAMLTADGAAARDGRLQPGDRLLAIAPVAKGKFIETQGIDQETVMNLLRGRIGTTVRFKVVDAAGANPREIELERGSISVEGRAILDQALQVHARLAGVIDPVVDATAEFPAVVVLRSGDVAPCRIEAIDPDGVVLRSPLTEDAGAASVRVETPLVKAVELIPSAASRTLDRTLLDRLLTLPRMQRDHPPTHLLRFIDNDYIRCRLLRVDERTVAVDVLGVAKEFPRATVARIIWLHPDVPAPAGEEPPPEPAEPEAEDLVVQSVAADGRRFTLAARGVAGDTVRGLSAAFGDSCIDLTKADRLLIGGAIARDGRELPYAKWKLKPAAEPRALATPRGE